MLRCFITDFDVVSHNLFTELTDEEIEKIENITIVACGSAWYAGVVVISQFGETVDILVALESC